MLNPSQQSKLNLLRARVHMARVISGRKPRKRQPPKQAYPKAIELTQARRLKALVAEMREATKEVLIPNLDRVVKRDALYDNELAYTVDQLRILFAKQFSTERLTNIARQYAKDLNEFNAKESDKVFTAVLGVPVGSVSGLSEHLDVFVRDNVRLIKSIPDRYLDEVEGIVNRGARAGRRASDMAAEIFERTDVSESRAVLIARDQSNKLYGELTQLRQKSMGVSRYTWRTSRDEKVRDSHASLEGQIFSWEDPPDVGHPGFDIRCRCTAEPVIDDVLNELEE